MIIFQKENFFPDINLVLNEIKNMELYNQETFNKRNNDKQTWPGFRSDLLSYTHHPALLGLLLLSCSNLKLKIKIKELTAYIHLRTQEDNQKDWIHTDSCQYSLLVYLNKTNLNSGTKIFDNNNNEINDIKYVQNRAILYNGSYRHMGYGHFGDSVDDGRLTLNLFFNETTD